MRRLLVLLLLTLLAVGAYLLLHADEDAPQDGEPGARPKEGDGETPTLIGRGETPAEPAPVWTPGDAVLEGLVVDGELRGAPGVTVEARPLWRLEGTRPRPWHLRELTPHVPPVVDSGVRTHSKDDGTFRLTGLSEGWHYAVTALPDVPACGTTVHADVDDDDVVLQVRAGSTLRVRVVDRTGRGVACSVSALPARARSGAGVRGSWELRWTPTAPDGRLVIPAAPQGAIELGVRTGPDRVRSGIVVLTPTEEEILLRVDEADGVRVHGRVQDTEGSPVAGATVVLHMVGVGAEAAQATHARTTADADGRYEFSALPEGTVQGVGGEAPGFVEDGVQFGRFQPVHAGAPAVVDVTLVRAFVVRGRVLDREGSPVPGVALRASQIRSVYRVQASSTSDAQGHTELHGLGPGHAYVRLASSEYLLAEPNEPELDPNRFLWFLPAGQPVVERDLVVRLGSAVRGRVVDTSGRAVPGAAIEFLQLVLVDRPASGWKRRATTDDEGRFAILGLHTGPHYGLRAVHEDRISPRLVTGAGPDVDVELRLRKGAAIEGRVLDVEGQPAGGIQIEGHGASGRRVRSVSDAEGAFRFGPLPPDTYTVRVSDRWVPTVGSWSQIELGWGETNGDAILELAAPCFTKGRVVDASNQPVPGSVVRFSIANQREGRSSAWTRTDATGHFEIGPLAPVLHAVTVDMTRIDELVEGGSEDVRLVHPQAPLRSVTGVIHGPDGERVAFARVRIEMGPAGNRGERSWSVQAVGGRFAWTGRTEADAVNLRVRSAADAHGRPIAAAPLLVEEVPLDVDVVRIDLPPSRVVRGRVVDEDGRGVAGARLAVTPSAGPLVMPEFQVYAEKDGTFEITGLPDGAFTVLVHLPVSSWARLAPIHVGATQDDLPIVADRGVLIEGRVVLPDGRPVRSASVHLYATKPRATWATTASTDSDGRFHVRAPTGEAEVKVRVTTEYGDAEAKRHTAALERVVPLPAVDLEFRLTPSVTIEGVVVNARGDPVTSFLLLVKRAGDPSVGPAQFVNPESESNRFVAAGLVAGAYTIQLFQPYSNERVEVTAPATDVRITTP